MWITSSKESCFEVGKMKGDVILVEAQAHDAESISKNEAWDHAFRMGTAWWDVKVKILAFLKEVSFNFTCWG